MKTLFLITTMIKIKRNCRKISNIKANFYKIFSFFVPMIKIEYFRIHSFFPISGNLLIYNFSLLINQNVD